MQNDFHQGLVSHSQLDILKNTSYDVRSSRKSISGRIFSSKVMLFVHANSILLNLLFQNFWTLPNGKGNLKGDNKMHNQYIEDVLLEIFKRKHYPSVR